MLVVGVEGVMRVVMVVVVWGVVWGMCWWAGGSGGDRDQNNGRRRRWRVVVVMVLGSMRRRRGWDVHIVIVAVLVMNVELLGRRWGWRGKLLRGRWRGRRRRRRRSGVEMGVVMFGGRGSLGLCCCKLGQKELCKELV